MDYLIEVKDRAGRMEVENPLGSVLLALLSLVVFVGGFTVLGLSALGQWR